MIPGDTINLMVPTGRIQMTLQSSSKIVSRGGNYLLNVGPTAEGIVPEKCVEVLNKVGEICGSENSEAIFGTRPLGVYAYEIPGIELTGREHKLYVHVLFQA